MSIPDDVVEAIDKQSERMGMSRSAYVTRIARFHLRALSDADRTQQINRFLETAEMELDPFVKEAARKTFERTEW